MGKLVLFHFFSCALLTSREIVQLSGQRASACTCKADASEHPGPDVNTGRGAPESTFSRAKLFEFDCIDLFPSRQSISSRCKLHRRVTVD